MKNIGLSIKGLCKQIKADKNRMIWSLKDGVYSITNRHWMITLTELPREVKTVLLTIFGDFPEEGRCLQNTSYSAIPLNSPSVDGLILDREHAVPARKTDYLLSSSKVGDLRIFKAGEDFIYIKESFLEAIDPNLGFENMSSFGKLSPFIFEDLNYVVLPVRIGEEKDLLTLKELTNE
ncbi:hypothetical protein MKX59_19565 [Paenibacillus sp. FSL R7-0340]|uniref:hypothetical protein n=1 Tax=Paenibacillus sp. FSL R7-0340 TaxID=2921684 RepID=UPI0030F4F752